jgi:uncharacterized protein YdeI (YjbR/CyaY-like superfamily)
MAGKDNRIDAYIEKSAPFAQPILKRLRSLVHKACPGVQETIKWGFPHFEYNNEILCNMAAFKQHCSFGFWKATLMKDPEGLLTLMEKASMGHFGRISSLDDIPSEKIVTSYIKEAMKLNEEGIKVERKAAPKKELDIPAYFTAALSKNKKALRTFEGFSPSNKRDYIEWITEAKTDATRDKRLETAIEWMAEGKTRHWKYQKK